MKYCPNCGVSLVGGAAPYCKECGKRLHVAKPAQNMRHEPARVSPASRAQPCVNTKKQNTKKRAPNSLVPIKRNQKQQKCAKCPYFGKHANSVRDAKLNPNDDGYDGYYDDVKPIDDGQIPEQKDPELVKRIVLIAAAALFIVILSVVLMSVL